MADLSPDTMLTRDKAAAALSEMGYPVSKASLATMASRGGGPIFRRFSKRALYRWTDLVIWAETRCSAPRNSTSETDVA